MNTQSQSASLSSKITKSLEIGKHLVPYGHCFTKPTRAVFQTIIREMLVAKIPNSTDLAFGLKKSISSVSYFFNKAKWDHREIEKARKIVVKNAEHTRSSADDIICLDATTISKTGKTFPDISRVFDTADKKVKDGYYLYVASIVNLTRSHSYIADWILIAPKAYHFKSLWMGWFRLLRRIFAWTKAKLVVLDAGFRNQYLLHFIMQNNRFFLIRVTGDMILLKNKIPIKLRTIKKQKGHAVKAGNTKLVIRIVRGVMKAWSKEIPEELTVIMIKRDGFRHPLILATNQTSVTLKDAVFLYQAYCKRWSIEVVFKELKLEIGLEKFRVRSMVAILRYLTLVVLLHTILVLKLGRILDDHEIRLLLETILRTFRKIQRLLIASLKKLYEMASEILLRFKINYSLQSVSIQSKSW